MFIVVVYFVIDSVRKLLDTPSYVRTDCPLYLSNFVEQCTVTMNLTAKKHIKDVKNFHLLKIMEESNTYSCCFHNVTRTLNCFVFSNLITEEAIWMIMPVKMTIESTGILF
jgi:hypothetical protein